MNDVNEQIETCKYQGLVAILNDAYPWAVENFEEMERLCAGIGDARAAGESAYASGSCHLNSSELDSALKAFERAARYAVDAGEADLEAHSIMQQLQILSEKLEHREPVDRGKNIALIERLEAIPAHKISKHYLPSFMGPH